MIDSPCKPCPVCGKQPDWHGSMIIPGNESISCNVTDSCPDDYFGFSTGYLPVAAAIAAWNAAVDERLGQ